MPKDGTMDWIVFIAVLGAMWGLKAISIVKQHDDIIAADVSMSWTPLATGDDKVRGHMHR